MRTGRCLAGSEHFRDRVGIAAGLVLLIFFLETPRILSAITDAAWRTLGRPESRLIGVQYRGNDEGQHRGPYILTSFGRRSWEFEGVDERAFSLWRWLGIEYDMTTRNSPHGIHVLGRVNPHMRNRRLRGEMTYYRRGAAQVFTPLLLSWFLCLYAAR